MKKKIKPILAVVAGLLATALLLGLLNRVLMLKRRDGILTMQGYYVQETPPDVLVLGSSHAGMHLDVTTLWEEQGIAAYNLWGAAQPFWNNYYNLLECLKQGTPKLVVLEVLAATLEDEYTYETMQVRGTAGMRFSLNKWHAIQASAPPERWLDLLLELPLFHTRYSQLQEEDYCYFPWSDRLSTEKGSSLLYGVDAFPIADVSGMTEAVPLPEKEQLYLEKIVELCREKEIPLVLLKTPSTRIELEQPYYNTLAKLAEGWGVPFLNTNLMNDQIGIEERDHVADGHLNGEGARKVGHWLGGWLKERYDLPDRRGEAGYESWDAFGEVNGINYLKDIRDVDSYAAELAHGGYRTELYCCDVAEAVPAELAALGIDTAEPRESGEAAPGYYLTVYTATGNEPVEEIAFLQEDGYAMSRVNGG